MNLSMSYYPLNQALGWFNYRNILLKGKEMRMKIESVFVEYHLGEYLELITGF